MELVEVKGTGKKLVQRTVGPFVIHEKINRLVYCLSIPNSYPMNPVVNIQYTTQTPPTSSRISTNLHYLTHADLTSIPLRNTKLATLWHGDKIIQRNISNILSGRRVMGLKTILGSQLAIFATRTRSYQSTDKTTPKSAS